METTFQFDILLKVHPVLLRHVDRSQVVNILMSEAAQKQTVGF
jgi:hypothetical protein